MENDTLFYILGGALTVLALIVSFIGLRREDFPPSGAVLGGVVALFAVLVAGTAVFAVASARDEQAHREAEEAEHAGGAASEEAETPAPEGGAAGGPPAAGGGAGTVLQLAADPTALAFDKTELTAKAGPVTIELDNPAPIPHNVAIEEGGQVLAESETVAQSTTSVSTELQSGGYDFVCTVPGHEEAGMKGTLTVE